MRGTRFQSEIHSQDIPGRIVIGVTGHRKLDNQPMIIERIRATLENIKAMVPPAKSTPLILSVLSPLAEGADRLVAREVLNTPHSILEVVLPIKKEDYIKDFKTTQSKKEFEELFIKANHVRQLSYEGSREEAYEQAGYHIVDHCDVLIALWDGKKAGGQGGTADIVDYARQKRCPLYWIQVDKTDRINFEPGDGLNTKPFHNLDEYNSEKVDPDKFDGKLEAHCDFLTTEAEHAGLPFHTLQETFRYIIGQYVRADILALRYQHLHHRAGNLVYVLAAAAIVLATSQILFIPDQPRILIIEVVFMVAALAIVWLSHHHKLHTKWIDYRFLAERFRSALFMAIINMDISIVRPKKQLSPLNSAHEWIVPAFIAVWQGRPRLQDSNSLTIDALKKFLLNAWIEDQIKYHEGTRTRHERRYHRMYWATNILFGLSLIAALLHVLYVGPHLVINFFTLMAISLPAVAGSITAIRTHRDYLRNSMRSAQMVTHLQEIEARIETVQDHDSFLRLVAEIEQIMLHENEDWRVVVQFHKLELPV